MKQIDMCDKIMLKFFGTVDVADDQIEALLRDKIFNPIWDFVFVPTRLQVLRAIDPSRFFDL